MASALLGLTGQGQSTNCLAVPAQLDNKRWHECTALIDSGASLNFLSHMRAKEMDITYDQADKAPVIRTLGGDRLQTYGFVSAKVRLRDSQGMEVVRQQEFLVATITGYDLVLGMPWLRDVDPLIRWTNGYWSTRRKEDPFLVNSGTFSGLTTTSENHAFAAMVTYRGPSSSPPGTSDVVVHPVTIPREYEDVAEVFSKAAADELPEHGPHDHSIELSEGTPGFGPLYNLSASELATLKGYLEDNLAKGFIRKSSSPAGAPILFVKKKDGTLRLCVDYRSLNRFTIKNRTALPLITESLDRLVGAQIFSKLDIRSAYNLIRIKEGHEWMTAFRTRYGHFEYRVMPFGLVNAPATFQGYINQVLREFLDIFVIVYLDDILIYSEAKEDHPSHVRAVLERLLIHRLYVNLEKCEFHTTQVEFLGYIVSNQGVSMDPDRVKSIRDWPTPASHREVQVFLGFANFYRRFIHQFSKVSRALSDLLKGGKSGRFTGPFQMTGAAREAFDTLKTSFTSAPMLAHYDPTKRVRLETDASGFALAAVLSQPDSEPGQAHWHPVAFWSRKMTPAERNYGAGDMEMLAIVAACRQWRHYVEGAKGTVTVLTDHANLQTFLSTKELNRRHARWWERLSSFALQIEYRTGTSNPADPPSRRPDYGAVSDTGEETLSWGSLLKLPAHDNPARPTGLPAGEGATPAKGTLFAALETLPEDDASLWSALIQAQDHDELAQDLKTADRESGPAGPKGPRRGRGHALLRAGWVVNPDGVVVKSHTPRDLLYVAASGTVRARVLQQCHDDPLAGHYGYARTLELLRRRYLWPGMAKDVKQYVATCTTCQRCKPQRHRPYGELQSLPQPSGPWQDITMDFITDLPPSKKRGKTYNCILVIVDRYTKMAHYVPSRKDLDAGELADVFVSKYFRHHGAPASIVTDRGTLFTSKFWSSLCFYLRIKRRLSTAFHPQTDGQTERQNQTLEQYLRAHINFVQDDWVRLLPLAEFSYNNSRHSVTGVSPFFLQGGYHPSLGIDSGPAPIDVPAAEERALEIQQLQKTLTAEWSKSAGTQAKYYDAKHTPRRYATGDRVWLSGRNIRSRRPHKKLDHKFHGPYQVQQVIGKQAYKLILPSEMKVHPVFHVSLLEPYLGRPGVEPEGPPPLLVDGEEEWEVEKILEERVLNGKVQYLVRFTGWGAEHSEWIWDEDLHADRLKREFKKEHPRTTVRALQRPPRRRV